MGLVSNLNASSMATKLAHRNAILGYVNNSCLYVTKIIPLFTILQLRLPPESCITPTTHTTAASTATNTSNAVSYAPMHTCSTTPKLQVTRSNSHDVSCVVIHPLVLGPFFLHMYIVQLPMVR